MRKLLWTVRLALVTLALILLPVDVHETRLSGAPLCAAEGEEDAKCRQESGSYCFSGGKFVLDYRNTGE
jgi:hypothetical protein